MLESPFAFLRGCAAVMAADIAPAPVTGLMVQGCGDMHVPHFGVYTSAERSLVFGINDLRAVSSKARRRGEKVTAKANT